MANDKQTDDAGRPIGYRGPDVRFDAAHFGTQCIHAGERWAVPDYLEPVLPIHNSNVYYYERCQDLDDMIQGDKPGYGYARWGTPTASALERLLSTLEGAECTLTTSSGMAAIHAALLAAGVRQGAKLICSRDLYGSSYAMIRDIFSTFGAKIVFADFTDISALETLIAENKPEIVYFEVMTNPLVKVLDAPAIIRIAHRYGAKVVIDNTFLTPYLYKPLLDGADYVIHSLSKYLSGHGDVIGGSISTRQEYYDKLRVLVATIGGVLSSNSAWLTIRGIKTFALRMERHCTNALALATFLQSHPLVKRVYYPGLPNHLQNAVAKRIFRKDSFGGMISFELVDGNKEKVYRFIDSLQLIIPGGSLGEVNSLILNPARTTHHNLNAEELALAGISPGLVRLSAGLEDVDDLKHDLDQALSGAFR